MDDIKLFAPNDTCLQQLVDTVREFSDDIKMSFGFEKCAKLSVRGGRPALAGPVFSLGDEIAELDYGRTYRYLGFPEAGGIEHDKCKEVITEELRRRFRLVWGSLLHGRFKVMATNVFCIPLLSYSFGVVEWTKAEVSQFDVMLRKILTAANSHHPRAAIERLYLPRRVGGRGIVNIEHIYQRRVVMLSYHLQTSQDPLVKACYQLVSTFPPRKSLISKADEIVAALAVDKPLGSTPGKLREALCAAQREQLLTQLCAKPLHGKFINWVRSDHINTAQSFRWLGGSLHGESESTILAIQDQVLCTRIYQAKIMHRPVTTLLCRFCHAREETLQHLLAGCEALASNKYLERHNMVARVVHWHLCATFHIPLGATSWYNHHPPPVVENEEVKILWDFGMITDLRVCHNRPDIVTFLKKDQRILFLEISCPADVNVLDKEDEKVSKYQALAREISTAYHQPVDIIPIVFGHSGIVSCHQSTYLKKLPSYSDRLFHYLQQAAILGTISVLRAINIGYA